MLWLSSFRYLAKHPWQTGLSILGVALGVAVVVAMDLANQSAKRAFNLSADAVAGRSTHRIIGGPNGIANELYRELKTTAGIPDMAPAIEGYATVASDDGPSSSQHAGTRLQILGLDPFAERPFRPYLGTQTTDLSAFITTPNAVLMSEATADSIGIAPGDELVISVAGIRHSVTLAGTIRPADKVSRQALEGMIVADIATAQDLIGSLDGISRIDVIVPDGPAGILAISKIEDLLPPGVKLERTAARAASVDQLTRAFEVNLTALSLLALLVGTFLIYNSITFSVVMRRNMIGTLRGIGVTRQQIFTLIVTEALLIGLVSSAIGIVLGILLGKGLVGVVTRTINDLFFVVSVRDLAIPASVLIKGGVIGVIATLIAAIGPAIEATQVSPRAAMSRSSIEARWRSFAPYSAIGGFVLLLVGLGVLIIPTRSLVVSFGGLLGILLGFALLVPPVTILLLKGLAPASRRPAGMMASMAARGVSSSISRTAVAIASLTIAVSITVGIGTMVQSFRGTVERWLDTTLAADIYISPPSLVSSQVSATVRPEVLEKLLAIPGIESRTTFRSVQVDSTKGPVSLVALDTDLPTFSKPRRFKQGDPTDIWEAFQRGDTVIVSEPLAYHRNLEVGSTVTLSTNQGDTDFRVAGIYFDYSSSQGVVMMARGVYDRYWSDRGVSSMSIYAAPDTDIGAMLRDLQQAAGGQQELRIRSNADLREASLQVFDRSFAITSVMRILAIIVAFVGVLSALMAMQLERRRELGTLRALGFTQGQVWGLITFQTGLMGLIAGILSIPIGLALASGLIFVVNRRSFGWSMDMQIFPDVLLQAVGLSLIAALLAGVYPAIRMALSSTAESLREE